MKKFKKPIRVLQCGLTENYGGVEAIIMNIYRNIDRNEIQFDFLTTHNGTISCEDEIKKLGGRIFRIEYPKKENIIKHYKRLKYFFKEHAHEFQVVHLNRCFPNYSLPLKYAKKYNIPIRIFHSHNSNDMYKSKNVLKETIKKIYYFLQRKKITNNANVLLSCSTEAGIYMFGKREKNNFIIINNGIDTNKYKYNETTRIKIRQNLNLQDKRVIGFVGRLQDQKNPIFVLKIFKKLINTNKDIALLMVGTGNLSENLNKIVENDDSLKNKVIFLGNRSDVNQLYQAMDLFLLPSKFEGLGIVLIEAQASGLPCITSKNVPKITKMSNNIKYLDLDDDIDKWCSQIEKSIYSKINRKNIYKNIIKNNFDISYTVMQLTKIYTNKE